VLSRSSRTSSIHKNRISCFPCVGKVFKCHLSFCHIQNKLVFLLKTLWQEKEEYDPKLLCHWHVTMNSICLVVDNMLWLWRTMASRRCKARSHMQVCPMKRWWLRVSSFWLASVIRYLFVLVSLLVNHILCHLDVA